MMFPSLVLRSFPVLEDVHHVKGAWANVVRPAQGEGGVGLHRTCLGEMNRPQWVRGLLTDIEGAQINSSLLLNSTFVLDEEFPHELKVAH